MEQARWIRQPIVVVLGHVDHGKTTLLDKIRGTSVAKKEPGEITQHVGASVVPASVLRKVSEPLRKYFPRLVIEIPGLLFIDTPGHELFANLRRRGGSVADIAILVVDVMEGFQRQTYESVDILRQRRVPFVVAANKIDRIPGWRAMPEAPFMESLKAQGDRVREELDKRVYNIVSELYKLGFESERFDRVRDFTRTIAIVPVSARTGEGLPELLALLAGLAQQFMKKKLITGDEPAKGVVLEVKEEPGLGTAIDVIIYDGVLRRGDLFVVARGEGVAASRVRALLMPRPLQDMRMHEGKFVAVEYVAASTGVKVVAPGLEGALAGSPFYVVPSEELLQEYSRKVIEEVQQVVVRGAGLGVVVKADALGSLEALVEALKRAGVPVRIADVGPVSKNDVIEASIVGKEKKEYGAVLAFNVDLLPGVEELAAREGVKVFRHNVIYQLLEQFDKWLEEVRLEEKRRELDNLVRPAKIRLLPGYVFRRSEPAIVGVEVLGGVLRPGAPLMREDGAEVGSVMQIQDRGNALREARAGAQVAISIKGRVMVGRHIDEGDVLYTDVPSEHARLWLTKYSSELSDDERLVLNEIIRIKRRTDPLYGYVYTQAGPKGG